MSPMAEGDTLRLNIIDRDRGKILYRVEFFPNKGMNASTQILGDYVGIVSITRQYAGLNEETLAEARFEPTRCLVERNYVKVYIDNERDFQFIEQILSNMKDGTEKTDLVKYGSMAIAALKRKAERTDPTQETKQHMPKSKWEEIFGEEYKPPAK